MATIRIKIERIDEREYDKTENFIKTEEPSRDANGATEFGIDAAGFKLDVVILAINNLIPITKFQIEPSHKEK